MPIAFDPYTLKYTKKNAISLAHLANLAYEPRAAVLAELRSAGFPRAEFIDDNKNSDTQVLVAGDDSKIIVAFRGSASLKDWFTDLDLAPVDGVHRGFLWALDAVWPRLNDLIEDYKGKALKFADVATGTRPPRPAPGVWFSGHSLGGALANLAAARLAFQNRPVSGLYTFGQPRAGLSEWARHFDAEMSGSTFRFVNNNDLVTRIPPRELGFRHTGTLRYFDEHGTLWENISMWRRFLDQVRGRLSDIVSLGLDEIKDHNMDSYVELVRNHGAIKLG